MTKLAGITQKLNILTTLPDLRNFVKWGYLTYYPRFSATLYALNRPLLNQICHSSAGSEDIEDGFLAVKWFLDGELLKEITMAPQCQNRSGSSSSSDDPKCNVDPSKIILGRNPK